jgi:hypothetical protein
MEAKAAAIADNVALPHFHQESPLMNDTAAVCSMQGSFYPYKAKLPHHPPCANFVISAGASHAITICLYSA